jgi:uncharacterized protein (DUF1499 family)
MVLRSRKEMLPLFSLLLLGVAVCLLGLAPLGWRAGLWPYGFGLYLMFPASAVIAAGAVILALATLASQRSHLAPSTIALLAAVVVAGASIVYVPLPLAYARITLPGIHDISTDTDDRPAFKAVAAARARESADRVDMDEPRLSQMQKAGYPDIAPATTTLPLRDTFNMVQNVARSMPGWIIVDADASEGRIEAMQRSRWFGFTDDVVIRVRRIAGGCRIDMRSASRKGTRDYGVNAARIRAYMSRLTGALNGAPRGRSG